MKKKLLGLITIIILVGLLGYYFKLQSDNQYEECYLASDYYELTVLDENHEEVKMFRGQKIKAKTKSIIIDDDNYREFKLDDKSYYAKAEDLVSEAIQVVKETNLYLKSSVSALNINDSQILGQLTKGDMVEVIGFDTLLDDGSVNAYYINLNGQKARIYAHYLSFEPYDNEILDVHKKREDIYGGGSAYELDYLENEKPIFEDNPMPDVCNTLYINANALLNIDEYINLAIENSINAFVVDIKDGSPTYASSVMEKYTKTSHERAVMSYETFNEQVKKIKEANIYLIGRITVFKDENYALDHQDEAIYDLKNNEVLSHNGSYWPSAYKRNVWTYNVELAKEAVTLGFNEIQFDYVRFPDHIDNKILRNEVDLLNEYGESKAQAIQRFIMYAADELHQMHAYISVDVFGETSNPYVTAYGQYWPAISNYVDVISAMPYPDHFGIHDYGIKKAVWEVPGELLNIWAYDAGKRQSETPSPARVRTWVQGYDSIKKPYVVYDSEKLLEQIKALYDMGLDDGFIIWNGASSLEKYQSFKEAFEALK